MRDRDEELKRKCEEHPVIIFCIMAFLTIPLFVYFVGHKWVKAIPESFGYMVRFWRKEFLED